MKTLPALSLRTALFPLGNLVMTSNIFETCNLEKIGIAIQRHADADWGDLCDDDKALNDDALLGGGRLFSAYEIDEEKIYIITEHDRSVTTVLFPSEY